MRTTIILVATLFFGAYSATSQFVEGPASQDTSSQYDPKLALKLDLTGFLNPNDPAILLYGEYFHTAEISFNVYAGKVMNLREFDNQVVDKHFEGVKVGQEVRYFFEEGAYGGKMFVGFNTQYRYLSIYDRYTLGFGCETGNCNYYKNFIGTIKTDRFSYEIKLGFQSELSERMLLEFDYGFGYHHLKVRRASVDGGYLVDSSRFLSEGDFDARPYFSFNLKLGYFIWVKNSQ